ncbi:diguanylate cyclase [Methylobacterium brachiatum]
MTISSLRRLIPSSTWIVLGVVAPICMLMLSALMLLQLRHDAWEKAELTSKNLLQVIERDIARNVEIIDLSLRGVIDNLRAPGVAEASPDLRQLILFDRAATARDIGVLLVIDERGDVVVDAQVVPPRKANYADREYFLAHKARSDLGLYISRPLVSRLTGSPMIALSRRITKADGSFGGVVLGTLKLAYFNRLFDRIGLGREGAINLYNRDGTRIMRQPYVEADIGVNIAGSANFKRFLADGSGVFVGPSVRDGVERQYAFTGVGDLPLVLNVAMSTDEIDADWRVMAAVIGLTVLALCVLTSGLSILFGRELKRRVAIQAELATLSGTDALTGIANRRRFDEVFQRSWDGAGRSGSPLSLLVIDADHFKRFNDRHGHHVGDAVLQGLSRCLSESVHRPTDLVARVGGEEFVLLLPDTDETGALRMAEKVHAEVSGLAVGSAGIGAGAITVSIGSATTYNPKRPSTPNDFFELADRALYEAKEAGRNQTKCAPSAGSRGTLAGSKLSLVRS